MAPALEFESEVVTYAELLDAVPAAFETGPFAVANASASHVVIEMFGGDNNLSSFVLQDMAEMAAGCPPSVAVLAIADFVNAPASMAPAGGVRPVFGTNPIAFAAPRGDAPPLVLDQSASVVAKSELVVHQQRGEPIPLGWALDKDGNPTTDPVAGLAGSMVPAGGYKGAGPALIVEMMAAWLTGASLSIDASSFADNKGGSPRTGQCFLAIDPGPLAGPEAAERLARLFGAIEGQDGARLPGSRRAAARERTAREGISIPAGLHARILGYAAG